MVSTGCLADFFTSAPELGFFGLIFFLCWVYPKGLCRVFMGGSWEGIAIINMYLQGKKKRKNTFKSKLVCRNSLEIWRVQSEEFWSQLLFQESIFISQMQNKIISLGVRQGMGFFFGCGVHVCVSVTARILQLWRRLRCLCAWLF